MTRPVPLHSRILTSVASSPFLWAIAATWGFYQLLPSIPTGRELLVRYLCSHPLEYVLTALFFTGLSIIVVKTMMLVRERRAFAALRQFGDGLAPDFGSAVAAFSERAGRLPAAWQDTYWGRRLSHLLAFFEGRQSSEGLHDHISYLADAESDRLHSSHSLLQTVIWSIPILGFLGTVMGITLAIANVTPDQLDTSLNEVTGGLAVAFDTTALALTFSLVLGFASLFIKRAEESLLAELDERCRLELHRCFPNENAGGSPLLDAERAVAARLLDRSSSVIEDQTRIWTDAVAGIRTRWEQTLEDQRRDLADILKTGTVSTLEDHAGQLAGFRQELLVQQEHMFSRLAAALGDIAERQYAASQQFGDSLATFAERLESITRGDAEQRVAEHRQFLASVQELIAGWSTDMEARHGDVRELSDRLTRLSDASVEQHRQWNDALNKEESLLRMQESLNRNLEAIRTSEAFDQTLHSLSAAVHLLTSRTRARDAA